MERQGARQRCVSEGYRVGTRHTLEHHCAVPQRGMAIATGALKQKNGVGVVALINEIPCCPVHGFVVAVVHNHHAVFGEERFGEFQTLQLVLVRVIAVVEVHTDGSFVHVLEILAVIHFEQTVVFAAPPRHSPAECRPRSFDFAFLG